MVLPQLWLHCYTCWYVVCSQKSLLGSHKMTWWHFDSFFMMDHFFTFVTKHENVEFRELMDEKNPPSHCIRIILKDSRKVFFSACLTTLYTISLEEMKSNYISSFSLIKVTRRYRFSRLAQDTKMSNKVYLCTIFHISWTIGTWNKNSYDFTYLWIRLPM